jgi:toxin-antitoxin system PIN domain toxin
MRLLDVNVLVYAHREDAERHREFRHWLEAALSEQPGVAVSELALSGCLRIITHPKVFEKPTPLEEAIAFVDDVRNRKEVTILAPGPNHWAIFAGLCRRVEARGNAVPDAYHAALAIEWGCEWMTADRGFARFPGLRWQHPLD